ncbi:hypothetical protein KSS87_021512 [Heliosperma pusillum]|nr:hypothetical protein KSS87_021512 [Heliosperma pusillum]
MSGFPENQLIELITETSIRLLQPPNSTPELLNLLDEVEFLLTKVGQAPSQLVQKALLIPMKALIADELFRHSDPDVRITIASCLNEVTRITAPIPPYDDDKMREIFELIVSSFENLSCQFGRCYSKAVLILQSVAKLRACVMMLDLDCDPLITKMFELFQRNISPKHPHAVVLAMVNIMSVVIEESDNVSTELVKVLLTNIRRENQSVSPTSWELSAKILESCTDKLRPYILETVSSMGFCLEDYAPILLSIFKPQSEPKPITVMNVINDSYFLIVGLSDLCCGISDLAGQFFRGIAIAVSMLYVLMSAENPKCNEIVNNEPYGNLSHRDPYVQALEAARTFDCMNAFGSVGTASQKRRKQNSLNLAEEPTGWHPVNDKPSGDVCHPPDYVQALEATECCQIAVIAEAEYVQALEVAECVNASENERTASKEGREPEFQNLDEAAIGLECEHDHHSTADDDTSKNNEIVKKEMDSKGVQEEADGFENKQVYHSCVLGVNKRKRGRPRKKDIEQQEFSGGSVNKDAFQSNDPYQNQRKQASLDEEVKVELLGNLSHSAESVQDLREAESVHCVDALRTGGTVSKEGRSSKSQNLDEEVTGLECEQGQQGTADDNIGKNIGIIRTGMEFERVKEEAVGFDNKQLCSSSAIGDKKRKRGRPRKNDVKQQELSGGSGNKSETGPSTEDKFQSNGCFQKERNRASSDDNVIETPLGKKKYEDLVGCRIKVWWPMDGRYYKGRITLFDASMRKHQVYYSLRQVILYKIVFLTNNCSLLKFSLCEGLNRGVDAGWF